jgi:hypothetical protein
MSTLITAFNLTKGMFNYFANANNFFIQDLKIYMVQTKGGLTSSRSGI